MSFAGRPGLVDRGLLSEAVRIRIQLDRAIVRPQHVNLVLDHLGTVLVGEPTEEDGIRLPCP